MKRGSTMFLRVVLLLIGLFVLGVAAGWLPEFASRSVQAEPELAYLQYPFLAYIYVGVVPFLLALVQALKLLSYIDQNKAFSVSSVRAFRNIKYCAVAIIGLLVMGELFVMFGVQGDRAGIVAVVGLTLFAATIIAAFAALLQKLLQNAVDIKTENDLTV